jgi:hypothetical protein
MVMMSRKLLAGQMTDPPTDRGSTTGTPLWVKVFGIIALALVVLFIVLILIGGHGPGRHTG